MKIALRAKVPARCCNARRLRRLDAGRFETLRKREEILCSR
jgi:hypothetical protein